MRRPFEISLDPLVNIAVCLVATLMLVIIATGAGTAETNVVIPTPIERHSTKRPIYLECRNEQLFLIPVDELHSLAERAIARARSDARGDEASFLGALAASGTANESYRVDLRHHIAAGGQTLAISPIPGARGHMMPDYSREPADGWYATLLSRMNHAGESIFFLVRDDSFRVFKNARLLAWQTGADVSFELLSSDDTVALPVATR